MLFACVVPLHIYYTEESLLEGYLRIFPWLNYGDICKPNLTNGNSLLPLRTWRQLTHHQLPLSSP